MGTGLPRTRKQRMLRRNKTQKGGKVAVRIRTEKVHPTEDKPNSYYTIDKGRKVYEIVDDLFGSGYVDVYKLIMDKQGNYTRGKRVLHIKPMLRNYIYNRSLNTLFESAYEDRGSSVGYYVGNGIFIFVGHQIYSFTPNDDMMFSKFFSPITEDGNCYPYLTTNNNTYFLRDHVVVSNTALGITKDGHTLKTNPYTLFYGKEAGLTRRKLINASKKRFDVKIIDRGLE